MSILQGMYLEESERDVLFKGRCDSPLRDDVKVSVSTTAAQQASQFNDG
jgi:hypothetical protein